MQIKIHSEIKQLPAAEWNALVDDNNPFMRHEFLEALENHGCVGAEFGWIPCHIGIYEDGKLSAAMPLYQKYNSYGEFVFDHAWADAYKQSGLQYFPKLVSATPYTPATGQRLLTNSPDAPDAHYQLLMQTIAQFSIENKISSFHCLFPRADQLDWLAQLSLNDSQVLLRHDVQFHWNNNDYKDFEDFLSALTAKKRKNIRQERKRMQQSGVKLRLLDGHTATDKDWEDFAHFYKITFEEKWSTPTLNAGFFKEVAAKLPDQVFLVLADLPDNEDGTQGECIAGSLMFRSNTRLYGRHWGCTQHIDKLHFEACYYQGIEYCIHHKLQVFEPGAQGEHKIARGFIPTQTRSAHWLNNSPYQEAIAQYVNHEKVAIDEYKAQLKSPYQENES
ncbi:N-acetyltransferase [Leucothrix sargassi]|nr:N-acetyltransferase [Leucothrix sargassi]